MKLNTVAQGHKASAQIKIRLSRGVVLGPKIGHFIAFNRGFGWGAGLGSKIGLKIRHQKVRLRAVWMGRKIASFWSSILGSKIRVEK